MKKIVLVLALFAFLVSSTNVVVATTTQDDGITVVKKSVDSPDFDGKKCTKCGKEDCKGDCDAKSADKNTKKVKKSKKIKRSCCSHSMRTSCGDKKVSCDDDKKKLKKEDK